MDDSRAAALGVALNRTGELANWDPVVLEELLEQIDRDGLRDAVSFSEEDFRALIAQLAPATNTRTVDDPGPTAPPVTPVSRLGDLWHLGAHRLLCGDATKLADVKRVMDGKLANLIATDPPYLVDYTGERPNNSGKAWSETYKEIERQRRRRFLPRRLYQCPRSHRAECCNLLLACAQALRVDTKSLGGFGYSRSSTNRLGEAVARFRSRILAF